MIVRSTARGSKRRSRQKVFELESERRCFRFHKPLPHSAGSVLVLSGRVAQGGATESSIRRRWRKRRKSCVLSWVQGRRSRNKSVEKTGSPVQPMTEHSTSYLRYGPLGAGICFCTTSQRSSVHRRQSEPAKSQLASATPLSCQSSQRVLTRAHSPPSG